MVQVYEDAIGVSIKQANQMIANGALADITIRRMVWDGELKSYKVGNRVMIYKSSIEEYIREHTQE